MQTFNNDTVLTDMLFMQLEFQQKILARRKQLTPSDVTVTTQSKVYEACYHASCMIVEMHELYEEFQNDVDECADNFSEDTKFELIDTWIFFLNQLLFSNVMPTKPLSYYFSKIKTAADLGFEPANVKPSTQLEALIGRITVANGKFIHNLRFKKWKEYDELDDNVFELTKLVDDVLTEFAQLFAYFCMQPKDVWEYFNLKFDENTARQQIGGKYEK